MTGFESKRQAAQAKLTDEADTLTIVYQRGFADGKKAAQPEQEPVAWLKEDWTGGHLNYDCVYERAFAAFPVYKHSPAARRKPLTDEEIQVIWDVAAGAIPGWSRHIAYARPRRRCVSLQRLRGYEGTASSTARAGANPVA
jgi:hypothetical protein